MKASTIVEQIEAAQVQFSDRPDKLHSELDEILLEAVPNSVAAAYHNAVKNSAWWTHG